MNTIARRLAIKVIERPVKRRIDFVYANAKAATPSAYGPGYWWGEYQALSFLRDWMRRGAFPDGPWGAS
jgi:hypothetical protein